MANITNFAEPPAAKATERPQRKDTYHLIVSEWKEEFRIRAKTVSGSRKMNFTYDDAVSKSTDIRSDLDEVMISYLIFMSRMPLRNNDYYKYVQAYRRGKKLNEKYFKHDLKNCLLYT